MKKIIFKYFHSINSLFYLKNYSIKKELKTGQCYLTAAAETVEWFVESLPTIQFLTWIPKCAIIEKVP